MTVTLRPAGDSDAPALEAIFIEAVMRGAVGEYSEDERKAWARAAPKVAARIGTQPLWVAEVDGQVVGFASVARDVLELIYVHPDWMRQGIGSKLMDACKDHVRAAGYKTMASWVSHTARPAFEASGWAWQAVRRVERHGILLETNRMTLALL